MSKDNVLEVKLGVVPSGYKYNGLEDGVASVETVGVSSWDPVTVDNHINNLSNASLERLIILSEECAEVVQVCSKIIRNGYNPTNYVNGEQYDNRQELENELGDILLMVEEMIACGELSKENIINAAKEKKAVIKPHLHYHTLSEE